MIKDEIILFSNALSLIKDKFYIDAIHDLSNLVSEYSDSDLADDALFNIALCYYEMNSFELSISTLNRLIDEYPNATISALEENKEFGETAAKAYYLLVLCNLGLGDISNAKIMLDKAKIYTDSYVQVGDQQQSFHALAQHALEQYLSIDN